MDLEGDWDPDAHDQQMAGIYDNGDGDGEDEDLGEALDADKPAWDDDIDIADIIPPEQTSKSKKKKKKKKDESLRDEGIDVDMMDADIEKPNQEDEEEWDGTDEMRKRKLDEYLDEIYGMEFNDMVRRVSSLLSVRTLSAVCRSEICRRASNTHRSCLSSTGSRLLKFSLRQMQS